MDRAEEIISQLEKYVIGIHSGSQPAIERHELIQNVRIALMITRNDALEEAAKICDEYARENFSAAKVFGAMDLAKQLRGKIQYAEVSSSG